MSTPDSPAPVDPHDAADNTGIGETGSFPGEHGSAKASATVTDPDALAEHVRDDGHEATGTPAPAEGAA